MNSRCLTMAGCHGECSGVTPKLRTEQTGFVVLVSSTRLPASDALKRHCYADGVLAQPRSIVAIQSVTTVLLYVGC